jgi:hypothetical protein
MTSTASPARRPCAPRHHLLYTHCITHAPQTPLYTHCITHITRHLQTRVRRRLQDELAERLKVDGSGRVTREDCPYPVAHDTHQTSHNHRHNAAQPWPSPAGNDLLFIRPQAPKACIHTLQVAVWASETHVTQDSRKYRAHTQSPPPPPPQRTQCA